MLIEDIDPSDLTQLARMTWEVKMQLPTMSMSWMYTIV